MGTEKGNLHCREAGECSGTVQGSTVLRHGRASATVPVLLGSGGHSRDSHCHAACPRKVGEACTAIHYAACKPRQAEYSKVVRSPVLSLNYKNELRQYCPYSL